MEQAVAEAPDAEQAAENGSLEERAENSGVQDSANAGNSNEIDSNPKYRAKGEEYGHKTTRARDEQGKTHYKNDKFSRGSEKSTPKRSTLETLVSDFKRESKTPVQADSDDTLDGAGALFYHRDPETGKVYFAFERKTEDYPLSEFRHKLAFIGGKNRIGETHVESLVRELREEDPSSYKILIKALKDNGCLYDVFKEYVDGYESNTSIYVAEIKDPEEWAKFASTELTEGRKAIKSLEELVAMKPSDFAFNHGQIIMEFIGDYLRESHSTKSSALHYNPVSFSLSSAALPSSYSSVP